MSVSNVKFNKGLFVKYLNSLIVFLLTLSLSGIPSIAADKVFFYHTDAVGTPLAMTDASGHVVREADHLPFGEEYQVDVSPGEEGLAYDSKFLDKQRDVETDLHYFGARYFDARIGRFTKPDSVRAVDPWSSQDNPLILANPQRLNQYAYGLNNPYKYVDSDGNVVIVVAASAYYGFVFLMSGVTLILAGKAAEKHYKENRWSLYNESNKEGDKKSDESKDGKRGMQNPEVKDAANKGKQNHKEFADKVKQKPGWQSEPQNLIDPATGKKVIPDAITPSGRPIELKPNTPSGQRQGAKQIKKYERATGKKGRVVYY